MGYSSTSATLITACLMLYCSKKLRTKRVLQEDEICFLEQLYARYKIRLGKAELNDNKNITQGSVISLALFNIFLEDLSDKLREKVGISLEDLLFYADDVLTLCDSTKQIEVIEDWSNRNGMSLNKKKSGIVIFANRKAKKIPLMKGGEDFYT